MLTIENFKEQVEKQVICKLSNNGDYEARYESKTSHLTFVPIFKNVKARPAFRLGDLYQMYRVRGDINGIIDEMVQIILKPVDDTINKIANNIRHYGNVRNRICGYIVNTKKSEAFLEGKVHKEFLDLSMVFIVVFEVTRDAYRSITITNEIAATWGVTADDLYRDACRNTIEVMGVQCMDMLDYIAAEYAKINPGFPNQFQAMKEIQKANGTPINYILTNKSKCKGAGLIFLSDAVKRYADEIGGDVKIIPSSINEILLTPANCDINSDEIASVNNGLSEDEILSDHPYIYIKGLDQIVSCN